MFIGVEHTAGEQDKRVDTGEACYGGEDMVCCRGEDMVYHGGDDGTDQVYRGGEIPVSFKSVPPTPCVLTSTFCTGMAA